MDKVAADSEKDTSQIMNVKLTAIVLIAGFITACSSSQKNPDFDEYLATNIRSDGSKEFYYTVTLANDGGSKRGSGKNVNGGMRVKGGSSSNTYGSGAITVSKPSGGGQSGRGGQYHPRADAKISEQLEKKLLVSGYCREGWMETDRHVQPPNASIRGECNESASDKDRENFPNLDDTAG